MKKKMIGQVVMFSLMIGLTGCGKTPDNEARDEKVVVATGDFDEADNGSGDDYVVGQGFKPPKGSHRDKNGNIVDLEGNTFDDDGKWQVPEGGSVDSQGRIRDKNGKLMGGGATVGSVG